jgi:hypothetical protein
MIETSNVNNDLFKRFKERLRERQNVDGFRRPWRVEDLVALPVRQRVARLENVH